MQSRLTNQNWDLVLQVNQQGEIGPEVRQTQGPSWEQQTWSRISRKSDNNNDSDPKLGGPTFRKREEQNNNNDSYLKPEGLMPDPRSMGGNKIS